MDSENKKMDSEIKKLIMMATTYNFLRIMTDISDYTGECLLHTIDQCIPTKEELENIIKEIPTKDLEKRNTN